MHRFPPRGTSGAADGDHGYHAGGLWYQFIQTRPERFFGLERIWVGEARVSITSLERTLLDGLAMPRYCGGFGEVVYAFGEAAPKMDVEKMVVDAPRLGVAVAKRLGWVLETQGIEGDHLEWLAALTVKGYRKLDASGPGKGGYNGRWMLQENLPRCIGYMRPLRTRLEDVRRRLGIRWEVLERDYLLSWVLAGIDAVPELRRTLVFKGGTALKKCYFGDYRFSEDLDFSGREGVPTGDAMEGLMRRACEAASANARRICRC